MIYQRTTNQHFISLYPNKYSVASFVQHEYPRWLSCSEIATTIGGLSDQQVKQFIMDIRNSPGGLDAIEEQYNEPHEPNKYRYIP